MTVFVDWLHGLSSGDLHALRLFRARARVAYPDAANPVEAALVGDDVPPVIAAMPARYVAYLTDPTRKAPRAPGVVDKEGARQ